MKKKLLMVFIFITFMPITIITVMAVYNYKNEINRTVEILKEVAQKDLKANDRLLANRIKLIEKDLNIIVLNKEAAHREIRNIKSNKMLIKEIFIVNEKNEYIFPPAEGPNSEKENLFINESEKIELILNLRARIGANDKISSLSISSSKSSWYTWFMGDGLNFIYFYEHNGFLYGFLLERYALISQMINALPHSSDQQDTFRTILKDARGRTLYQWGGFEPHELDDPLGEYTLIEPFNSWRFVYFSNNNLNKSPLLNRENILMYAGLSMLTLVLIVLSIYFYRENSLEMNLAKKQVSFVNQVSHELKTPLTNIRLYSELLENIIKDKKSLAYVNIIVKESSRLGRMINNVLTFSRSARGELKQNDTEIDINELIVEILDKFNALLQEKEMVLDFNKMDLPPIYTDRDMLEQIMTNIISNAIKYGSSGHFLAIEVKKGTDHILISFSDRGPGIANKERYLIFNPFYRIDNSLSQANSGTGIGLSIAKKLSGEISGDLKLEKSTIGACFSLRLPLKGDQ